MRPRIFLYKRQTFKNMKKYLNLLLPVLLVFGACNTDDTTSQQDPDLNVYVTMGLEMDSETEKILGSQGSIEDVNLFFYGSESRSYHFYFEEYTTPLTIQIEPGTYQIYVVANMHGDLGEMTEDELAGYKYPSANMRVGLPMTACTRGNIIADTTMPTIELKLAAAKISYTLSIDQAFADQIGLRSIQFCNIPNNIALWSGATSTSEEDFHNGDLITINTPQTFSSECYLPENCQGNVEGITNEEERIPENAPAQATYMRILAEGAQGEVEYIIYLGENRTSNFDVHANTCQEINFVVSADGIDPAPKDYEGLYYGTANCHICSGNSISFDAAPYRTSKDTHYYVYTKAYAGKAYEAATADLLWEDVKGLITSVSFENNQVAVTTNGDHGNAVIALYDDHENILWSFHIWVAEQPGVMTFTSELNGSNRYSMMDRELGALAAGGAGLTYQIGRKDPFPTIADHKFRTMYLKSGEGITTVDKVYPIDPDETFGYCGSIAYSVAHPQVYFVTSSRFPEPISDYGWVYPGTADQNTCLWGNPLSEFDEYPNNSQIQKSVYDPCPEGYKVAPNDALEASKVSAVGIAVNEDAYPWTTTRGIWGSGIQEFFNRLIVYKYSGRKLFNPETLAAGTIRCVQE